MHKFSQKRLNQMIEKAISYQQETSPLIYVPFVRKFKNLFSKPVASTIILISSLMLALTFYPSSRSLYIAEVDDLYNLMMIEIIDDF